MTQPTFCLQVILPPPEGQDVHVSSGTNQQDGHLPEWRIGCLDQDGIHWEPVESPDQPNGAVPAEAIKRGLESYGYRGQSVTLALPSGLCLPVRLSAQQLPKRITAQTLAYAVEPYTPLGAEDLTVAHCHKPTKRASSAFGAAKRSAGLEVLCIAVVTQQIQSLIDELESSGVVVGRMVPAVFLAALPCVNPNLDCLFIRSELDDLIELQDGQPVAWRHLACTAKHSAYAQQTNTFDTWVKRWAATHGRKPRIQQIDRPQADENILLSTQRLETEAAHSVLAPNLRTGDLAENDRLRSLRAPLNTALLAASILLVAFTLRAWFSGNQHQEATDVFKRQQEAAFRDALPGQTVPLAIRSRLISERNQLRVASGLQDSMSTHALSAWKQLDEVLSHLPQDIRFRIHEIRVDENRTLIEGEARTHSDADRIAAQLRRGELKVEPPRVSRLENRQGVRFSLAVAPELQPDHGQPVASLSQEKPSS